MASKTWCCFTGGLLLFLIGAGIFVVGWLIKDIVHNAIDDGVRTALKIQTSDVKSDPTSDWQTKFVHYSIDYYFYAYNISNYDQFIAGSDIPRYTLLGPYHYIEYDELYNISFSADGTIIYYNNWWNYVAADAVDQGSIDQIWSVNLPYLAGLASGNAAAVSFGGLASDGFVNINNFIATAMGGAAFAGLAPAYLAGGTIAQMGPSLGFLFLAPSLASELSTSTDCKIPFYVNTNCYLTADPGACVIGIIGQQWANTSYITTLTGGTKNKFSDCTFTNAAYDWTYFDPPNIPGVTILAGPNTAALNLFDPLNANNVSILSVNGLTNLNNAATNATMYAYEFGICVAAFGGDVGNVLHRFGLWAKTLLTQNASDKKYYEKPAVGGIYPSVQATVTKVANAVSFPALITNGSAWQATAKALVTFDDIGPWQYGTGLLGFMTSASTILSLSVATAAQRATYGLPTQTSPFPTGSFVRSGPEWAVYLSSNPTLTPTLTSRLVCQGLVPWQSGLCSVMSFYMNHTTAKAHLTYLSGNGAGTAAAGQAIGAMVGQITFQQSFAGLDAYGVTPVNYPLIYDWQLQQFPYTFAYKPLLFSGPLSFQGGLFVKRTVKQFFTGYYEPLYQAQYGHNYPGPLSGWTSLAQHYTETHQGLYAYYTGVNVDPSKARHYKAWRAVPSFALQSDFAPSGSGQAGSCDNMSPRYGSGGSCTVWGSTETIDGTSDGKYSQPFQENAVVPTLGVYITEAQRSATFIYSETVKFDGILLRRYRLETQLLYNYTGAANPDPRNSVTCADGAPLCYPTNTKYYMGPGIPNALQLSNAIASFPRISLFYNPAGVVNCQRIYNGIPVYLTKARLIDTDADFRANLNVKDAQGNTVTMGAYAEDYDSFIDVEPLSGATMYARKQLQLNIWLPKAWIIADPKTFYNQPVNPAPFPEYAHIFDAVADQATNTSRLIIPVLYANENGYIKPDDASSFKSAVYGNRSLSENLKIIFVICGFFIMLGGLFCMVHYWRLRNETGGEDTSGMNRLQSKLDITGGTTGY